MLAALKTIPTTLLAQYKQQVSASLQTQFEALKDADSSTPSFSFYTSVSAIASSRIEGEQMEIDSYLKHKMLNTDYQPDLVQKPNDLYNAYLFAQQNPLNAANFFAAHRLITAHLLPPNKHGALRSGNVVVMEHNTGRIQFEAAAPHRVKPLLASVWADIDLLMAQPLSHAEVFYFAAFIHLIFVCIHPFDDGNGRAGRLLEKWFIAQKLGPKAWFLQSELLYYNNVNHYYKNLNCLGIFYDELDYSKATAFLLMLVEGMEVRK